MVGSCKLPMVILFLSVMLSIAANAAVLTGNITLEDFTANSSSKFNFLTRVINSSGHMKFTNLSASIPILEPVNNATRLWSLTFYSDDLTGATFRNNFRRVPNATYTDFMGHGYDTWPSANSDKGFVIAVAVSSGINTYYGALFVKNVTPGVNITFEYKYNNASGNTTFLPLSGCASHTNFATCLEDFANDCDWNDRLAICEQFSGFHDEPPAECEMLPKTACDEINTTICRWNTSIGSFGKCMPQGAWDPIIGFNCTAIINKSVCINQSFTEKSGLCSWTTSCVLNKSKTFMNLPEPPVFSCEATGYATNQTNCRYLATKYYMPCGWNNASSRCEPLFFDAHKFQDFGDISSSDTCQLMSGTWRSETTFDPIYNKVSTENWCEFGSSVKTFDSAGSGKFFGNAGQLSDCSRDCFACEFNNTASPPGPWSSASVARTKCEASSAGCSFNSDTNAFNGQGWCNPAAGFGGFDCDSQCGDCMIMPNPKAACQNSSVSCRWDNQTNFCIGSGQKSCNQDCFQCLDQTSCSKSPANGGCTWDSSNYVCTPQAGSYEICYDGLDNDNNGKTDCQDTKCSNDPFCGGGSADTSNCFQFDPYAYGSPASARGNCTAAAGCAWILDDFSFGYCGPTSEQCFTNDTLGQNPALCNSFSDGNTCAFIPETHCDENSTIVTTCVAISDAPTCSTTAGCKWKSFGMGGGFCDIAIKVACEDNESLQTSQTLCNAAGCYWQGDEFTGGFEGFFNSNCVAPCYNNSISDVNACKAANGTDFFRGSCVWQAGFCEPKDFIGGCFENDGDLSACQENSNCNWYEDRFGGIVRNPNGSTSYEDAIHTAASWMAAGLSRPTGGANISRYQIRSTGAVSGNVTLIIAKDGVNTGKLNISWLFCNNSIVAEYNWTNKSCGGGVCNKYSTYSCSGKTLHYYLNVTTRQLEVLWENNVDNLVLDVVPGNLVITNTVNKSTVVIDGNFSDQVSEAATANDLTLAARVRTSPGFCDDGLTNTFFQGMDQEPPLPIAADTTGSGTDPSQSYLDLSGLGVKKTPEAYMYGMPTLNINGTMLCNGVPIGGDGSTIGSGTATAKYYLYLDTDGISTGGCAAVDDSSKLGFEYLFKYVTQQDATTGRLSETFLTQQCSSGTWIPSNVPFKSDTNKGCGFVSGPIFAIGQDSFTGKTNVNTSISWRAYATSAAAAGNTSNISDAVGPGKADFKGIDASIIDCSSTADKDNSQCSKFKQFGFFPGEFGPACTDNKDNDGDSLTDCDDWDCKYDPFFCSGSFGFQADDSEAPTFVWTKVNKKIPTSLSFIFDTNEPANGTVKYYYNDSTCALLNATLRDKALDDGDAHTNYRPHHIAELTGLRANTTYFYKLKTCDPSANCALSKCSNATTASKHTNITFKLDIPAGWTVDIPSINLTNYSAGYAIKASSQYLHDINITANVSNTTGAVTFVGLDIFEKQTLNLSQFILGQDYTGMDTNLFQSFKQKTGVESVEVTIPFAGNAIQHCDDDGANCQDVSTKVDCTFGAASTVCTVPDAVGLGLSTYKPSTTAGGSTGGGGGGGGGSSQCNDKNDNDGDGLIDYPSDPGCSSVYDSSETDTCTPRWLCTGWAKCKSDGTQTRTCVDKNNCGVSTNKPDESQSCTYVEPEPAEEQPIEQPVEEQPPAIEEEPKSPPTQKNKPLLWGILGAIVAITGVSFYIINRRRY